MSHHSQACDLIALARQGHCAVDFCPQCGVVHIQMQFVTLKLERDALPDLARLLCFAEARLSGVELPENVQVFEEAGMH